MGSQAPPATKVRKMLAVKIIFSSLFLLGLSHAASLGRTQHEPAESGLVRLRRAPQLVGSGHSLAFLRNTSSGVGGTKIFNPALRSNTLGSIGVPNLAEMFGTADT